MPGHTPEDGGFLGCPGRYRGNMNRREEMERREGLMKF